MNPVSSAIVMHEILGARSFASRFNRLPLRLARGPLGADSTGMLRSMGFEVGAPIEEAHGRDPLFVEVVPPEGWTLTLGQDPVESRIRDAEGCERAIVYFKASLHDRRADLNVLSRYHVLQTYLDAYGNPASNYLDKSGNPVPNWTEPAASRWSVRDRQTGADLHAEAPTPSMAALTGDGRRAVDFDEWALPWQAARDACDAWLADAYPDPDPTAYWEPSAPVPQAGP